MKDKKSGPQPRRRRAAMPRTTLSISYYHPYILRWATFSWHVCAITYKVKIQPDHMPDSPAPPHVCRYCWPIC